MIGRYLACQLHRGVLVKLHTSGKAPSKIPRAVQNYENRTNLLVRSAHSASTWNVQVEPAGAGCGTKATPGAGTALIRGYEQV